MIAALAVSFIGGAKALTTAPAVAPPAKPIAVPAIQIDHGVAGFAELYVTSWLSLTRETAPELGRFYAGPVDMPTTRVRLTANRTTVIDQKPVAPNYWSVTVAADVAVTDEGGVTRPLGVRYYSTGVFRQDGALIATSLPAQVPAPPPAKTPQLAIRAFETPAQDTKAIADALVGFFRALLTGTGELDRYITPGLQLGPVAPVPFTEVTIRGLGDEPGAVAGQRTVRVELSATNADTVTQVLHYTVTVTQRDSRWEVAEVLPATPLAAAPARSGR